MKPDVRMRLWRIAAFLLLMASVVLARPAASQQASERAPLVIGETFTLESRVLGEERRINVYRPKIYAETDEQPLPVLYMPDGGIEEDFLHIAGLLQISVMNGTMRPFLLVGIENTERRRDLTGPTDVEEDRAIAPRVGGSAEFRGFIRNELMPVVKATFATTDETAIVGESLAGLFIVETFLLEPDLFDTYIAFDPSLWWNGAKLLADAPAHLQANHYEGTSLYFASSSEEEMTSLTESFAEVLEEASIAGLSWYYEPMPDETHGTIYHPAALAAFRSVFRPALD